MKAEQSQLCCQERQAGPHEAQAQGEDRLIPDISFIIGFQKTTSCLPKKVNRH